MYTNSYHFLLKNVFVFCLTYLFFLLGTVYLSSKEYVRALLQFEKVLKLDPNNTVAQKAVGQCHILRDSTWPTAATKLEINEVFHNSTTE